MRNQLVSLDIIIPIYNEEEVLPFLISRLDETFSLERCKKFGISQVVYIFIDDGSKDKSVSKLFKNFKNRPNVKAKIIRFSRNFGHQSAISAGIDNSLSDLAAIIDADLQDPPEVIIDMINKWREGYEVVYAVRTKRKENIIKKSLYWLFYRIYRFFSPIDVALDSGDFCLMGRQVIAEIKKLPESLRFLRGLRAWVGFAQTALSYDRPARVAGGTKYTLKKLYQLATDGITSISIRPLKAAQLLTLIYFFISLCVIGGILIDIVFKKNSDQTFLLLLATILVSTTFVLFCLYIIGAYVGRTYLESKGRPNYIIQEVINLGTIDNRKETTDNRKEELE